jgi:hypothetical protein
MGLPSSSIQHRDSRVLDTLGLTPYVSGVNDPSAGGTNYAARMVRPLLAGLRGRPDLRRRSGA